MTTFFESHVLFQDWWLKECNYKAKDSSTSGEEILEFPKRSKPTSRHFAAIVFIKSYLLYSFCWLKKSGSKTEMIPPLPVQPFEIPKTTEQTSSPFRYDTSFRQSFFIFILSTNREMNLWKKKKMLKEPQLPALGRRFEFRNRISRLSRRIETEFWRFSAIHGARLTSEWNNKHRPRLCVRNTLHIALRRSAPRPLNDPQNPRAERVPQCPRVLNLRSAERALPASRRSPPRLFLALGGER